MRPPRRSLSSVAVRAVLLLMTATACDAGPAPRQGSTSAASTVDDAAFSFDGYGRITIGMTKAQAVSASPVPLAVYGNNTCTWLYDKGVAEARGNPARTAQITLDRAGVVRHIDSYVVVSAHTDRGIRHGATLDVVLRAYPEPSTHVRTQADDVLVVSGPTNDLSFELDESQKVVAIAVGYRGYALGMEDCVG